MPKKSETPLVQSGASRDKLAGVARDSYSLDAARAQFLMLAHHVRLEWAVMITTLAFGGAV